MSTVALLTGLPYFHVDFGLDNGFAHVIEDEPNFSRRFGHEVVGGMMDIEARTFRDNIQDLRKISRTVIFGYVSSLLYLLDHSFILHSIDSLFEISSSMDIGHGAGNLKKN